VPGAGDLPRTTRRETSVPAIDDVSETCGVVGVTAGRSAAEEAADLDTYQGQRPNPTK
jgi:hypothetical protein